MVTDKQQIQEHLKIAKQLDRQKDDKPVVPRAGIFYGDTIYWATIAGAVVTLIGQVLSFVSTRNHISTESLMSSLWKGRKTEELWAEVGGAPNGHWYLEQVTTGDGLTMLGLAIGVFSVTPAILGASFVLLREKRFLFAGLAIVAAAISVYAMLP